MLPVQRPAEIVNYRTMGTTPLILAGLLAAGAVMALALTLAASVRRRSRELALLKTLGFVRRQVVAAVIWQAVVIAAIGTAIGVPLGVAAGRFLWVSFAAELYVVPQPVISTIMIAGTVVSALAAPAWPPSGRPGERPGRQWPLCSGPSERSRRTAFDLDLGGNRSECDRAFARNEGVVVDLVSIGEFARLSATRSIPVTLTAARHET